MKRARRASGPPSMITSQEVFDTNRAAAISGASLRQLQWWDEQKLVSPSHPDGRDRRWDQAQVMRAALTVELRSRGVTLRQCRRLLNQLMAGVEYISAEHPPSYFAVTDCRIVRFFEQPQDLIEKLNNVDVGTFTIDLVRIYIRVLQQQLPKRAARKNTLTHRARG